MHEGAAYNISINILSSVGIVALRERWLKPAYAISVLVFVRIFIRLTIRNSFTRYFIK